MDPAEILRHRIMTYRGIYRLTWRQLAAKLNTNLGAIYHFVVKKGPVKGEVLTEFENICRQEAAKEELPDVSFLLPILPQYRFITMDTTHRWQAHTGFAQFKEGRWSSGGGTVIGHDLAPLYTIPVDGQGPDKARYEFTQNGWHRYEDL